MVAVGLGRGLLLSSSLALHTGLDLAKLGLAGQQLLSLLVDLALDLELDLAQLLLFSAELLLLETNGLGNKVLGVHRAVDTTSC